MRSGGLLEEKGMRTDELDRQCSLRNCAKFSQKVQNGMANVFGWWGEFVTRCTLLVFILSMLVFAYAALGIQQAGYYNAWPPEVSKPISKTINFVSSTSNFITFSLQGIRNFEEINWIAETFGWQATQQYFEVIIMAKGEDRNLVTLPAFKEMIELNDYIFNAV